MPANYVAHSGKPSRPDEGGGSCGEHAPPPLSHASGCVMSGRGELVMGHMHSDAEAHRQSYLKMRGGRRGSLRPIASVATDAFDAMSVSPHPSRMECSSAQNVPDDADGQHMGVAEIAVAPSARPHLSTYNSASSNSAATVPVSAATSHPSTPPSPSIDLVQRKKQRRRAAFSVFVDPDDHPDNHVMRHLTLCTAEAVPQRDRCLRLQQLLGSHPLFRTLSPELTRRVFREFIHERREAGTVLFRAGDMNDVFFLIDAGEVSCESPQEAAVVKRAGETIGDLALMQPCPSVQNFTAAVSGVTPAHLFSIDGALFRFLIQHGMQLRYHSLKTFFSSLSVFAGRPATTDMIENLIDHAQILEFSQGDVIVPAPVEPAQSFIPTLVLSPPQLTAAASSGSAAQSSSSTASLSPSPQSSCVPSPMLFERAASPESASACLVSLSSFPPHAATAHEQAVSPSSVLSPLSAAAPLPSYLATCVFLVKEGSVSVARLSSSGACTSASLSATTGLTLSSPMTQSQTVIHANDVFGLEILECPHRLLDHAASAARTPPLMSPALVPRSAPFATSAAAPASTSPSARPSPAQPSPKGSRKRVRAAGDDADVEVDAVAAAPAAAAASTIAASASSSSEWSPGLTRPLAFTSQPPSTASPTFVAASPRHLAAAPIPFAPQLPLPAPALPPPALRVQDSPLRARGQIASSHSPSPLPSPSFAPAASSSSPRFPSCSSAFVDSCVSSCGCRGVIRCASAAAVVIAVEAAVWKSCMALQQRKQ